MRASVNTSLIAIALLIGQGSYAVVQEPPQDKEIRILIVVDPQASTAEVADKLTFFQTAWNNTTFQPIYPTSYTIAGQITITGASLTGASASQLATLDAFVNTKMDPNDAESPTYRDFYGADVVLGFSPDVKFDSNPN